MDLVEIKKYWQFSLTIGVNNETKLNWSYLSPRGSSKWKNFSEELLQEFRIELVNEEGILVKERIPKIIPSEHKYYEDVTLRSAVLFDDKTTEIIIYRYEEEVFRLPVPQEKPYIKLLEKRINTEKQELKWDFKSSTPEFTWCRVFIQLDNGNRYPLSDFIRNNTCKINYNDLPGCERGKVVVMVSDGVWTAEDISEEFKLPLKKPIVKILTPKNGQKIQSHDLLQLSGRAWDEQNLTPIGSENLVWNLDGKKVGTGKIFVMVTIIAIGKHIISLEAVDSNGISNSDQIEIEIFQAKHPKIIKKIK